MAFFSVYAYLNQEYDRLGDHTESQLSADFLELIKKPAKTLSETKRNLVALERKLKNFRDKMSKEIDPTLKKSVFITIIDPITKREFLRDHILDDYKAMRTRLTNIMCHELDAGPTAMEIGSVATNAGSDDEIKELKERLEKAEATVSQMRADSSRAPGGTTAATTGVYATSTPQNGEKKKLERRNCGEEHPMRLCQKPFKPELQNMKGKGKGGEVRI